MMQINVDPSTLNREQREALAGFILTYPVGGQSPQLLDSDVAKIADTVKQVIAPEDNPATGAPEPSEVFPDPVSVAFGDAAPLPLGATPAPFTAGVNPSLTAPAAMPVAGESPNPAPLPPAPPFVPLATTAAPTATNLAQGVEKDANGLPWDARIHSSSKEKIANGTWKKKRGVDLALVTQVEAELRGVMGAPAAPVNVLQAPTAPPAPVIQMPPAAPQAPAAPVTQPSGDERSKFVALIGFSSNAIKEGKLSQGDVTEICNKYGLPALPMLANRLDLVEAISLEIRNLVASR